VVHNPITHNFQHMLLHYLEVLSQAQSGAPAAVDAAANGTYLIGCIVKCVAESAPSSCLQSLFDVAPNLPQLVQGEAPPAQCWLPAVQAACGAPAGWAQLQMLRPASNDGQRAPSVLPCCCAGLHTLLPLFVNRCLLFLCNCHPR
jgi:hypothetical protein